MPPTQNLAFPIDSPYRLLAASLDALPQRFPPAVNEAELRLLAYLFTPEEANLAAGLQPELETPAQIAARLGREPREVMSLLKDLSKKGLVSMGKTPEDRLGFGLIPFVVGFYENQGGRIDAGLAERFEDYFKHGFADSLKVHPQVHRVVPVRESIQNTIEVRPYESVTAMIDGAKAWGVINCICRTQKALIGEPCGHPLDVCMILSSKADEFSGSTFVRALTHQDALQTLRRAADAGLVHCVSNNQQDLSYICNCCTCSCGVLRGMAEMGIAGVVARSAYVNRVDEDRCAACGECLDACQFNALTLDDVIHVNELRCAGCGVCVLACPQEALHLERRVGEAEPPLTEADWRAARALESL